MKNDKINTYLTKATFFMVRFAGMCAFLWQIIQFFTGKWNDEWYKEVAMLVVFFIFARYPKEILELFKRKTK